MTEEKRQEKEQQLTEGEKIAREYGNKSAMLGDMIYHAWALLGELRELQVKSNVMKEKEMESGKETTEIAK